MRLISQTGDYDIPYELSVVNRVEEIIVAYSANYKYKVIVMGTYSTSEKAEKVMERLHRTYGKAVTYTNVSEFRFPKDDDV